MKILFIGTVEFSRRCLLALRAAGHDPALVVTMPETEGRERHGDWANLAPEADGIEVKHWGDLTHAADRYFLKSQGFDLALVCGWSRLLPLDLARVMVGSHPSLLPQGRGRHPISWALILGLEETGLSFFHMTEEPDAGNLAWQGRIKIGPEDDAGTLYEKVCVSGEIAMGEIVPAALDGRRTAQDHSLATYWPKRTERDCRIDWGAPAGEIVNLVRGLARPYVGAWTTLEGRQVRVWRARTARGLAWATTPPGTIQAVEKDRIAVAAWGGLVEILKWDLPAEHPCRPGMRLG